MGAAGMAVGAMTQLQALDCTGSFGSAGRLPTEGTPVWAQLRALHYDEGQCLR